ncbi:MAG: caspase family protein [Agriterribacter sp.]
MSSSEFFEDGYALLIGLGYHHWPEFLPSPLKDIEAIKNHFLDSKKAAYRPQNILTLCETDATTMGILSALDTLARKVENNPDASVIIYYTGHGGNKEDKYFLIPYDFNLVSWDRGELDNDKIILSKQFAEKINAINVKKCLVILDCCHSENIPVEKSIRSNKMMVNGKGIINDLESKLHDFPIEKGISANIKKGSGRVIFTSCASGELSLDLGYLSLFTKILIECLNGKSNIENDGWVRLIDLMRYVPKNVAEYAQEHYCHQQHPVFKRIDNLTSEDFIICAYDINQVKGLMPIRNSSGGPIVVLDLAAVDVENGELVNGFEKLDSIYSYLNGKIQYNLLKDEFIAGVTGYPLTNLIRRLTVFIQQEKARYKP